MLKLYRYMQYSPKYKDWQPMTGVNVRSLLVRFMLPGSLNAASQVCEKITTALRDTSFSLYN